MREEIDHYQEWVRALDWCEKRLKENPELRQERGDHGQDIRMALGLYKLRCFANRIRADQRSTWVTLTKTEALRLYLINKHHWTPAQVDEAATEELDYVYLLHEELLEFKLNEEESYPPKQWSHRFGRRSEFEQHFEQ
ncbi:hypothetical protein [Pseudomonas protegens]|nr:hypothetical protein [Pseudomonas protegens]